jgi:uncharacterized phage protein (predicted DNA packaging)
VVTLAEAKDHCRVAQETDDQDDMLNGYVAAAQDHLSSIGVDMTAEPLPPALKHAVLMMVAHFYLNAEAVTTERVWFTPIGVDRLIAPYRSVSL